MRNVCRVGAVLGAAMATSQPAAAQEIDDKYWIEVGAYLPDVDSQVRVAATNRPQVASTIDLESDLDLSKRKALPQVNAGLRFGSGRWSLDTEFYSLRRRGSATLRRDIAFDDAVYPVGVRLDSGFDSSVYRATVGYAFVKDDNTRIGAALGVHATDFTVRLSGAARVGEATVTGATRRRTLLAPLPTIGLFARQQIAPGVTLSGRIDYLSLKISDYKGRLVNAQGAVTWRFARNFGIGAMYRYVDYRVDVDKPRWNGRLKYGFSGPALFLRAGFR